MALTQVSRGLLSTSIVDNGNATAITIDASENVGIGTASPSVALQVSGQIKNNNGYLIDNGTNAGFLTVDGSNVNFGSSTAAKGLAFFTAASTQAMTIDSSARVGIGTSSPSTKLEIRNDVPASTDLDPTAIKLYNNNDGGSAIEFSNGVAGKSKISFGVTSTGAGTDDTFLGFSTGANAGLSERMRIDQSGELTLGNPSGGSALQLDVSATGTDGVDIKSTFYSGGYGPMKLHAGGSERMRIQSTAIQFFQTQQSTTTAGAFIQDNGRYIGVTNAALEPMLLNRQQSAGTIVEFRQADTVVGTISVTSSATAYNTSSDQRLKENIQDADDAGSKIDAMQVRSFDWKADGSHQKYGMVAQELQSVAPEAVTGDADSDEMMGVDYSKLVPMLVKEIQSLRSRVQQLEN